MDGLGAVGREHRDVMDLARRAGLDDEAGRRPQALRHEMLVDRRRREQSGDRDLRRVDLPVRHDQDVEARLDGVDGLGAQRREARLDAVAAPGDRIADVELVALELVRGVLLDGADHGHVDHVEERLRHLEAHRRVDVVDVEQVRLRTHERDQRHHELFADRIDRRVGHLREQLPEVVEQRLVLVGRDGQWRVVAHRAGRLLRVGRHRRHQHPQVFLRVAERLLTIEQRRAARRLDRRVRARGGEVDRVLQRVELDADAADPLAIRLRRWRARSSAPRPR